MTDYTELVKALRCETSNGGECWEKKCQYLVCGSYAYCNAKRIMADAAAAIEALQAEVKRLKMHCADCEYGNSPWPEEPGHEPKRGEWIIHGEPPMLVIECSVCGQKYFNHVMQEKAKYCSMCGAKMEVQDGKRCD